MQGFGSGVSHNKSKRLYEKLLVCKLPRLHAWRSDSTQSLTITFESFGNEIKVSNRNAASEIHSEFIHLC